jgi:hypothetical protein
LLFENIKGGQDMVSVDVTTLLFAIFSITAFGLAILGFSALIAWLGDFLPLAPQHVRRIRRAIWNRGLKLSWHRLWIRKNEFHQSLSLDWEAIEEISLEKKRKYLEDLDRRRHLAHVRDLERFRAKVRARVKS